MCQTADTWGMVNYTVENQSLHTAKIKLYTVGAIITHFGNKIIHCGSNHYTLQKFIYTLMKKYLHTYKNFITYL